MNFTETFENVTDMHMPDLKCGGINNLTINGTRPLQTATGLIDVITAAMYGVIFTVGLCGNILVIATIAWSRHLQTAVNAYLVNLCVADLLLLLICMPTAAVDIFAQTVWYFGPVMCRFPHFCFSNRFSYK